MSDNKIIDFKSVIASNRFELDKQSLEFISNGYEPYGTLQVVRVPNPVNTNGCDYKEYVQQFIKYEKL